MTNKFKKFKPVFLDKSAEISLATKQPIGKRWLEALEQRALRLKNRKKKPLKPAPHFRAALVKRQKKARN